LILKEVKAVVKQAEELLQVHKDIKLEKETVCKKDSNIASYIPSSFLEAVREDFWISRSLLAHTVRMEQTVTD